MADEEDVFVDIVNDSSEPSAEKRRARGSDEEREGDEEEEAVAPARSAASKRAKAAQMSQDVRDDLPPKDKEEEDEDEEEERVQAPARAKRVPAKRASRASAATKKKKKAPTAEYEDEEQDEDSGGALSDDEEDAKRARQKKRAGAAGEDEMTNNEGIIERIHLINFMNHANLEVELGPQINFITGPNGSGKSAILVGLALCLGAGTAFTQRAAKLGENVRSGSQKAIISVTLRNVGAEAYKPELYGRSITVERTIVAGTGSSSYKFKDHGGRVVTKERTELGPLCDRFNIQINNPCIIMMQETSRDFMTNSSARKKYELFERATQIKVIQEHLSELLGDIAAAASTLERKRALFPSLQRQHEQASKEHEEIMHLKKVKESMVAVKAELVWAQVEERETRVSTLADKLKENRNLHERNLEKLRAAEERLAAKTAEEQRLAETLRDVARSNEDLQFKIVEFREQDAELSKVYEKVLRSSKTIPEKVSVLEKRIKLLQSDISKAKAKSMGERGGEEMRRFEKLNDARDKHSEAQTSLAALTGELKGLKVTLAQKREELASLAGAEQQAERDMTKARNTYANCSSANKDPAALWGQHMPRVRELIKKHARDFKRAPIGPLGMHIRLERDEFDVNGIRVSAAMVIEQVLGKLLGCFWCDNHDDNRRLRQLLDAERLQVRTVVQPFRDDIYSDLTEPAENKDYVRLRDCIACEPAAVFNVLVDQAAIESAIMLPDQVFHQEHWLDIRNVKRVFLPDTGHKSRVGRENSVKFIGPTTQGGIVCTLKLKNSDASTGKAFIERTERELKEATARKADLTKRKTDAERAVRNLDANMREKEEEVRRATDEVNAAKQRLQELEHANESVADQGPTVELEVKLAGLRETLEKEREKQVQVLEELRVREVAVQESKKTLAAMEAQYEEGSAKSVGGDDKARAARRAIAKFEKELQLAREKLRKYEEKIEADTKDHEAAAALLASGTEAAMKAFPNRVPVTKSVSELEKVVSGMEAALLNQQKNRGKTVEEIEKEYLTTKAKVKKVGAHLDWLQRVLGQISIGLDSRNDRLQKIRVLVAEHVSAFFNMYLTKKGYEGGVKFVHDRSSPALDVSVNLNPNSQSQASQDPLTLSGGETSFSTVALLLSLWEVIDTPFRIMDEFDIFMDAAHRQISINVLIDFARQSPHRQFIFLSPLDSTAIPKHQPDIRIKNLDPPIRDGQMQMGQFLRRN
jgi:chromosome segregation ATPase